VQEVEVDVDEIGFAVVALDDEMVVPQLLGEGARVFGDFDGHVSRSPGKGIKPVTNSAARKA
jgi:hypothetical protein